MRPGMAVLYVENRIIARLLLDLLKVEIEHRVVLAVQHHETDGVLADLVHDFPQSDEIARALRHLHRFARAQQPYKLHDFHIEHTLAVRDRLHGGLHPLDVAAVVGAPHVDHLGKAAVELGFVVGDVGGEVSIAAVRFEQRTIDVVAESGGAEQCLVAILPVLDRRALRRWQTALVDFVLGLQLFDRSADLVAAFDQRAFRIEHVVLHIERSQILTDHRHHHRDGLGAHQRKPLVFRHLIERAPVLGGERLADGFEIIARIESVGDRDRFAKRLAIAQEGRTREHVDLRACVVDVVLARHVMAGEGQQVGERIAEHRAAAMPDMHRAGRVGRDVFDIDLAGRGAAAIVGSRPDRGA